MNIFRRIFPVLTVLVLIILALAGTAMAEDPVKDDDFQVSITTKGPLPKTPETFTVRMTAKGKIPMPGGSLGGTADLQITGAGSGSFSGITYDNVGIYQYTIELVPGTNLGVTYDSTIYNLKVTVHRENGKLVVTRALRKQGDAEKIDNCAFEVVYPSVNLKVQKIWDDNYNENKKRPGSVKVTLKANGKDLKTVTLSEMNRWASTVKGLPVYENNTKIVYTWTEEDVKGYTLSSTKTSDDGLKTTLTNKVKTGGGGGTPFIPDDDLGMGMIINVGDCLE